MDDDPPPPRTTYRVSAAKMSKTPSWIMLGFVLGALFVLALPPLEKKPAAPPETLRLEITPPPAPREPKRLTVIEDVFAVWGSHAIWSDDLTEVALWNSRDKAFSDCYEVRRVGEVLYFRTIPALTRRILTHGKPMPDSPLRFTETEEQYREWREHGRSERPVESTAPLPPRVVPSRP